MRTDPVTLQVLRNHTRAAAESMATTLYRTAHSTFVKETEDFTIQIIDAHGNTVTRLRAWSTNSSSATASAAITNVQPYRYRTYRRVGHFIR